MNPQQSSETGSSARQPASRSRRAVVTRHGLLVAAGQRFASDGYHGASLREILDACGVTKGALYFHFPGKQALVHAIIAETTRTWAKMAAAIEKRGSDPLHALIASVDQVFVLMQTDPIVHGAIRLLNDPGVPSAISRRHYEDAEAFVAAHLSDAAAAGLLRDNADVPALARLIITTVTGHRLICDRSDALDNLSCRIEAMWQTLLPLIAADHWLDRHLLTRTGPSGPSRSTDA